MRKVYTIGETTYDIIFKSEKPIDAKIGGSMLNSSVTLGRTGVPVSFISFFGNDHIGKISEQFLKHNGVQIDRVYRYNGNTRLSLAFLDENNNADYTFYKITDIAIELSFPEIKKDDIILFGSSFAIRKDIRNELVKFLKDARNKGAIIIYDPNFRKVHISAIDSTIQLIEENMELSHIIKGSDDDFMNIFDETNPDEVYNEINTISKAFVIYTANKNGVYFFTHHQKNYYTVKELIPVSTIGAGDNFNAGLIYSIYKNHIKSDELGLIRQETWDHMISSGIEFSQHVCMSLDNYISEEFARKYYLTT